MERQINIVESVKIIKENLSQPQDIKKADELIKKLQQKQLQQKLINSETKEQLSTLLNSDSITVDHIIDYLKDNPNETTEVNISWNEEREKSQELWKEPWDINEAYAILKWYSLWYMWYQFENNKLGFINTWSNLFKLWNEKINDGVLKYFLNERSKIIFELAQVRPQVWNRTSYNQKLTYLNQIINELKIPSWVGGVINQTVIDARINNYQRLDTNKTLDVIRAWLQEKIKDWSDTQKWVIKWELEKVKNNITHLWQNLDYYENQKQLLELDNKSLNSEKDRLIQENNRKNATPAQIWTNNSRISTIDTELKTNNKNILDFETNIKVIKKQSLAIDEVINSLDDKSKFNISLSSYTTTYGDLNININWTLAPLNSKHIFTSVSWDILKTQNPLLTWGIADWLEDRITETRERITQIEAKITALQNQAIEEIKQIWNDPNLKNYSWDALKKLLEQKEQTALQIVEKYNLQIESLNQDWINTLNKLDFNTINNLSSESNFVSSIRKANESLDKWFSNKYVWWGMLWVLWASAVNWRINSESQEKALRQLGDLWTSMVPIAWWIYDIWVAIDGKIPYTWEELSFWDRLMRGWFWVIWLIPVAWWLWKGLILTNKTENILKWRNAIPTNINSNISWQDKWINWIDTIVHTSQIFWKVAIWWIVIWVIWDFALSSAKEWDKVVDSLK